MRYVGRPPGTITLGSAWGPEYVTYGQQFMPKGVRIVGGSDAPNDFELDRIYGYHPVTEGWVVGRQTTQPPGVSVTSLNGFSQAAPMTQAELDQKRAEEELKSMRWNRIVGGVIALSSVGALVLSIAAYKRR